MCIPQYKISLKDMAIAYIYKYFTYQYSRVNELLQKAQTIFINF